eukprot:scaffold41172_cov35-Tisochrysis_lutea.AAC.1
MVLSRRKKPTWLRSAELVRVSPSVVVYEREQKGSAIRSARHKRLFPECQLSQPHAITYLGPSTGGAVVDALRSPPTATHSTSHNIPIGKASRPGP